MQAKYEDGKVANVGDVGKFVYGNNDEGYQYDGIVTNISESGRLEIRTPEGYPVTLIMANIVTFTAVLPQDVGPQDFPA